jgi:hypothetical protein
MNGDPFDILKERNPMPRDRQPDAPMSVAARIMSDRPRRTSFTWSPWTIAAAAAAFTLLVGGGAMWWMQGGDATPAAGTTTTTTAVSTTVTPTTTPPTTGPTDTTVPVTTIPGPGEGIETEVQIYLMSNDPTSIQPGPYLIPVTRTVDTADTAPGVAEHVVSGIVLFDEEQAGLSSAIPAGTVLDGITIEDGVATIDLSPEFVSGGGSLSMQARLAQVVFTLTRLEGVDGVRFLIDGQPTTVFGGEGVIVSDPATRDDFAGLQPAIMIESPAWGGTGSNPLIVSGTANVFEATVSAELLDKDGEVLWEGFTTHLCGTGCRGAFDLTIPYDVDEAQLGLLRVWEASAEDGREVNVREHPVYLEPAVGPGTTCSAAQVGGLDAQDGLPAAVATTRGEVFAAAVACDYGRLEAAIGPDFSSSFGGGQDHVDMWRDLEIGGQGPMRYLAELLKRPFGTVTSGDGVTYYVWPSVFGKEWAEVTDAERDALRPLYDEADFDAFEGFGAYIGYRILITEGGEWVGFIAGD